MITRADLLTRARSALNHKTVYRLGGGETDPSALDPRDKQESCDCSSFICWALGLKKWERGRAWLKAVNDGHFNTDGVWWDAVKTEMGIFDIVDFIDGEWAVPVDAKNVNKVSMTRVATEAKPGDLIVYPAAWVVKAGVPERREDGNPSVGHIALITDTIPDATKLAPMVIDCSSGNWNMHGDAIREHRWLPRHPAAVVARCSLVVD